MNSSAYKTTGPGFCNNRENIVIHTLQQAPELQYAELLALLATEHYVFVEDTGKQISQYLIGEDNFDQLMLLPSGRVKANFSFAGLYGSVVYSGN